MDKLDCQKILSPFFLLPLLQFSCLLLLSTAYNLPDHYFINCGSDSDITLNNRNFTGDINPGSFSFSPGQSEPVKDSSKSTDPTSLYQTARIYRKQSPYELDISQTGTYVVRLHFQALSSPTNLYGAIFNVSTSNFSLLSSFSIQKATASPVIKEFLLTINVGRFYIFFTPSQETSLAFVNAIEVFLAPESFIPDEAPRVTPAGLSTTYKGLVSQVLHTVHRINVGGFTLTPENDTLWRNWVPDDEFLVFPDAAINSDPYSERPKYQTEGTRATEYTAPDHVYKTAKEMNINSSRIPNNFNITWRFQVSRNTKHLVRVHFCDIISVSLNTISFYLYIYSNFSKLVDPYYSEKIYQLAVPFYFDFLVVSDNSGFMNISIGPRADSTVNTAFLNGVEMMELMEESGGINMKSESNKKRVFVIVGLVVGGVLFICILLAGVLFGLKWKKAKAIETLDWPSKGRSSYSKETERSANATNFNLGLKMPFSELQGATKNFAKKMKIGEGGFGKVYKGKLRDGRKVAVKRSEGRHGQGHLEFETEIMVLSSISHKHLVSLIGYCDDMDEMILVYEFMENGTLRDHLYKHSQGPSKSLSELSWKQRVEICIGAARGLQYLHTSSVRVIIHRDVKSTNILLDGNFVAKVADFGLSKSGPLDQTHVSTVVKGSFGYLDPEYFRCLQLTDKSDVYSFGVVLLEVLCARPVINNSLPKEQENLVEWAMLWQKKGKLEEIIDPFLMGKIKPKSLSTFVETAEKCLRECSVDRPTMSGVVWDLEYVLNLQEGEVPREPHEDSIVDASLELSFQDVRRLPFHSFPVEEEDDSLLIDDGSDTIADDVFSKSKNNGAR